MPRTSLTVQDATRISGVTPTSNTPDAVNGNRLTNDGKTVCRVTNGSGGALTVTVDYPSLVDTDLTVTDRTYTIADGTTKYIGPWPVSYNQTLDSTSNQLAIDWSTSTSVTVEVIRVTAV